MSKIVKAVTKPGLGDPLGISKDDPRRPDVNAHFSQVTGGRAPSAAERKFMDETGRVPGPGDIKAPSPAPHSPSFPSFSYPQFQYPEYPRAPKAKSVAERLKEEALAFDKALSRESVFSKAAGLSTRLRAAVSPDRAAAAEDEDDTTPLADTLGFPTLLGSRSRGGQTSFRRKRIKVY